MKRISQRFSVCVQERKENLSLLPVPGLETFAGIPRISFFGMSHISNFCCAFLCRSFSNLVWRGIIFLNQMPNPPPLRDFLGDLPEKLKRYDLDGPCLGGSDSVWAASSLAFACFCTLHVRVRMIWRCLRIRSTILEARWSLDCITFEPYEIDQWHWGISEISEISLSSDNFFHLCWRLFGWNSFFQVTGSSSQKTLWTSITLMLSIRNFQGSIDVFDFFKQH